MKDKIEEICGEMSELERNAEKSSRQVVQQMICHHLKKYIGHEFNSTVTGITDFGLFAEIDNFYVSGLIHVTDLPGDRYFYDRDAYLLKGKRTGRVYRLGQDIKIKIMNVLPSERKITLIPSKIYKKMNKKENVSRVGFHSIESILENNPHKIKKVTLPANRNDQRISSLILALEKNNINYDLSSKLKQEPEAIISHENELNFKDLKNFISSEVNNPLILILDNIIDPRNLGACIRSAAVTGVDALIINKHHCAPINAIAHKVSVGGAEVIKIFYVTNLINCLKFLKELNVDI